MTEKLKGFVSFFLRFGISAALLAFLFSRIDTAETLRLLTDARMEYVGYALLIFIVIHLVLIVRWMVVIRGLDLDIPLVNVIRFFFIGLFGNLFLPSAIGGDIIKAAGLCARRSDKQKVIASILLDRLSGFAGMVVLALAAFVCGFRVIEGPLVLIAIAVMGTGLFVLGAILFHEKLYTFCCRMFSFWPGFRDKLMQMHYDIALLKGRKNVLYKAIALSCGAQILLAVVFWCLAQALHQNVMFFYLLIFTPMTCVASSLPSVGGLGFREAGLEYLLVGIGVVPGIGVSIGLLDFVFMVIIGVAGYFIFLMTRSR